MLAPVLIQKGSVLLYAIADTELYAIHFSSFQILFLLEGIDAAEASRNLLWVADNRKIELAVYQFDRISEKAVEHFRWLLFLLFATIVPLQAECRQIEQDDSSGGNREECT